MSCKNKLGGTHRYACDCREAQFRRMEQGLKDIMKHIQIVAGKGYKFSSTWQIARNSLTVEPDFDE